MVPGLDKRGLAGKEPPRLDSSTLARAAMGAACLLVFGLHSILPGVSFAVVALLQAKGGDPPSRQADALVVQAPEGGGAG